MPKICYTPERKFTIQNLWVVDQANIILNEYEGQGFTLTLRQLYYQFVARDLLPNTDKNYKRLGAIINDARLAGLIDWYHLIDRTRNLRALEHFEDATDALNKVADWYHVDMWENQKVRPEVWVEKDALVGIVQRVCDELDVPYFSCRGYTSQSEMWRAGQRLARWHNAGYQTHIIHLGDHDPSGMDMSRDIFDRLEMFMGGTSFKRIALNMDQVKEYGPPPNPAKITDSRAKAYIQEFGDDSWELDALDPNTLTNLIKNAVDPLCDRDIWRKDLDRKIEAKNRLYDLAERWEDVKEWLDNGEEDREKLLDALARIQRMAVVAPSPDRLNKKTHLMSEKKLAELEAKERKQMADADKETIEKINATAAAILNEND